MARNEEHGRRKRFGIVPAPILRDNSAARPDPQWRLVASILRKPLPVGFHVAISEYCVPLKLRA